MTHNLKKISGVALALMLVMSVFAGSAAAVWNTTSDVTDSTQAHAFGDSTTDEKIRLAVNDTGAASAADVELRVTGAAWSSSEGKLIQLKGVELLTKTGAQTDSTNGAYYFSVNESELTDGPGGDGRHTVHFEIVDTTDGSVIDNQTIDILSEDDDVDSNAHVYANDVQPSSNAFDAAASAVVADSANVSTKSVGGFLGIGASDVETLAANGYVRINGSASDIVVHTGDRQSALDNAADGAESGDVMDATMTVNNEVLPVYFDSAPEAASNHSYAVYDNSTGTVTATLDDDYADSKTVTWSLQSHNNAPFGVLSDQLGFGAAMSQILPF